MAKYTMQDNKDGSITLTAHMNDGDGLRVVSSRRGSVDEMKNGQIDAVVTEVTNARQILKDAKNAARGRT